MKRIFSPNRVVVSKEIWSPSTDKGILSVPFDNDAPIIVAVSFSK